jgi:hypothetical protein
MDLETELKNALKRQRPSAGFADRVAAAARRTATLDKHWQDKRGVYSMRRALAAAALLTIVLGSWTVRTVAQRREGERARQEVMTAMRLTGEKLRDARAHVHEIGETP